MSVASRTRTSTLPEDEAALPDAALDTEPFQAEPPDGVDSGGGSARRAAPPFSTAASQPAPLASVRRTATPPPRTTSAPHPGGSPLDRGTSGARVTSPLDSWLQQSPYIGQEALAKWRTSPSPTAASPLGDWLQQSPRIAQEALARWRTVNSSPEESSAPSSPAAAHYGLLARIPGESQEGSLAHREGSLARQDEGSLAHQDGGTLTHQEHGALGDASRQPAPSPLTDAAPTRTPPQAFSPLPMLAHETDRDLFAILRDPPTRAEDTLFAIAAVEAAVLYVEHMQKTSARLGLLPAQLLKVRERGDTVNIYII